MSDIRRDIEESAAMFASSEGYAKGNEQSNAAYCYAEGARWAYRRLFGMWLDGSLSFGNE